MLDVENLHVYYDKAHVLQGINLQMMRGEIISFIGPNGAGKTTLLNCISGLKSYRGKVSWLGYPLPEDPVKIVDRGIIHCTEHKNLFSQLSVQDNLTLGAFRQNEKEKIKKDLEWVYTLFPILRERKTQMVSTLSGGEQQMLAIGRALTGAPKLLLLDEPALGLAPLVRRTISHTIKRINKEKVSIILAEQNVRLAISLSQRIYLLKAGKIALEGRPERFKGYKYVRDSYLGSEEIS